MPAIGRTAADVGGTDAGGTDVGAADTGLATDVVMTLRTLNANNP